MISIPPQLLSKAATDNKTGQWLEENLKRIPDVMSKIQQNADLKGVSINFKI